MATSRDSESRPGLPEVYQRALLQTVHDLDIVTELVRRNLNDEDIHKVLGRLGRGDRDAFIAKLSTLLRKTSALLLISRRMSDSLLVDVLLPRLIELISEFLDAERCSVFLHDPRTGELYTKSALGLTREIRFPADRGIAGTVFASGQPLLVSDAYSDPRFNPEIDEQTGFHTRDLLSAPLRHIRAAGAETVGVIQVLNCRRGQFGQEDLKLLEALSSQAAAALANALLHEEVRKARAEESRLLEVTAEISRLVELPALLAKIVGTAAMVLEADRVTLFVQDRRTRELWAVAQESEGAGHGSPSHPEIGALVFDTGAPVNLADPWSDPRFDRELDRAAGSRTRSILCMPVLDRSGAVVAVAEALEKRPGPFTAVDERRLDAFGGQVAIVLENARLFDEWSVNLGHLSSLLDASKALASPVDLDSQLEVILARARDVMEADASRIFEFDEQTASLWKREPAATGATPVRLPVGLGIAGHVARTGALVNVRDAQQDPRFDPRVDRAETQPTDSVLCAPMFSHGRRLIGVLQVLNKRGGGGFTPHDEALMEAFASHAGVALERAHLIEAVLDKQRMEEGLRLAHEIQMGMLPRQFPVRPEFEICAHVRPARAVGGDLYDFLADRQSVWFVVGDVSGKGVAAALFMAMTKTLIRARIGGDLSPAEVLARVHRELVGEDDRAIFVTAFVGCLDLATGRLRYSNAGHNAPYLLAPDGRPGILEGGRGLPLGILGDHPYDNGEARLRPGNALFLYTDGVTEALNREGGEFSRERLESLLESLGPASAEALVRDTFDAVRAFAGEAPQSDDITVMALRYLSP